MNLERYSCNTLLKVILYLFCDIKFVRLRHLDVASHTHFVEGKRKKAKPPSCEKNY